MSLQEVKDDPSTHGFRYYSKPSVLTKVIGSQKMVFGTWGLVGYLGQFILIISSLNHYADDERFKVCDPSIPAADLEGHSKVYDTAFILLCTYHIVEWVRMTLFLVTVVLGTNFMHIWYFLGLNTIYGIATYIYLHVVLFSSPGSTCRDSQYYRGQFLLAEVIVFWLTFHIMSFPHFFLLVEKKSYIEEKLNNKDDEEEDDGDKKD